MTIAAIPCRRRFQAARSALSVMIVTALALALAGSAGLVPAGAVAAGPAHVVRAAGAAARAPRGPGAARSGAGGTWTISTVAGGTGGPAPSRTVGLAGPCALASAGGYLYEADSGQTNLYSHGVESDGTSDTGIVRRISMRTGALATVAGSGFPGDGTGIGNPVNGIPATGASLEATCGVAVDRHGNVLVTGAEDWYDGNPYQYPNPQNPSPSDLVRVAAVRTGTFYGRPMTAGDIYTIAGDGTLGFSGDGGLATRAELSGPAGLAVDPAGNVIVADTGNDRVRVIAAETGTFYGRAMTAGDIYTIAGTGKTGFSGDGGPATRATLSLNPPGGGPAGGTIVPWPVLAVDFHGNLVLADPGNCQVRVIAASTSRFYGRAMVAGDIYGIAGQGLGLGGTGCGSSGDGGPAARAKISTPAGVAVDHAGNVVISDPVNERIWVAAERSGTFYGIRMAAGDIYAVAGDGRPGFSGDRGPARDARFSGPAGVAVDGAGNLVIADGLYPSSVAAGLDLDNERIRVVAARTATFYGTRMTAGDVYAIAGTSVHGSWDRFSGEGGPATAAELPTYNPFAPYIYGPAVTLDSAGDLLDAEPALGRVLAVPARSGRFYGIPVTAGHTYAVAGGGPAFPGGGRPARDITLRYPTGAAADDHGNLIISDQSAARVIAVAARAGTFYGVTMRPGRAYDIAGDGTPGSSGDRGPATRADVRPSAVAVDGHGNLVIADYEGARIRVVAARSGRFYGQQMTAGHIYTVAGDGQRSFSPGSGVPANSAAIGPAGAAADRAGNLVLANPYASLVEIVAVRPGTFYGQAMKAGNIYTIAGHGLGCSSGEGGPALAAVVTPQAVALDTSGNVLIADGDCGNGGLVRVVAEHAGTYYGAAMTAGHIYTIAGLGYNGLGDGGPARLAELVSPTGLAVLPSGAVLVADDNRIRLISSP